MGEQSRVYFLVDASGSTVRDGFNAGWNHAQPLVVSTMEELAGPTCRLCVVSFGTVARIHIALTPVRDVVVMPPVGPAGVSSLVAGLQLLADVMGADSAQLTADGLREGPAMVWIVTDGLPTDPGPAVLRARSRLDECVRPDAVHLLVPAAVDDFTIAGLHAQRHTVTTGDQQDVARSVVSAVRAVLRA